MARKVKLRDTGEESTSDIAYKAEDGKYYSSEYAYKKMFENKEYRKKCIDLIYEVLGYKESMIVPTFFYKSLQKFEGVGYEALYNTMLDQNDKVQWALKNKDFNGETAKVMYIMAIYNNNVMDTYKKMIADKKLKEIIDKKDTVVEISENVCRKQETKNISRFLED